MARLAYSKDPLTLQELPMLPHLSVKQVELALQCLAQPEWEKMPPELESLSMEDWMLLEWLLAYLMSEREHNQVH
jgi:hypothetical protein